MKEKNLGNCVACGEPKDTYTKRCSECLHKDRVHHGKMEGRSWVKDMK